MKKQFWGGMTVLVLFSVILLGTCEDPNKEDRTFSAAPKVTLTAEDKKITVKWQPSDPAADSYDVYYLQSTTKDAQTLVNSDKAKSIKDRTGNSTTISQLENDKVYGVVVTAKKPGYASINSAVVQATPSDNGGQGGNGLFVFATAPVLTLRSVNQGLEYLWTPSSPATDVTYDLYWKQGNLSSAADVKTGTKVEGATSDSVITGLTNGTVYSVVVTANKEGYNSIDSDVAQETPATVSFAGPAFSIVNLGNSIRYLWPEPDVKADSYDVYYKEGYSATAAEVKTGGTKVTGAQSGGSISVTANSEYSVVLTANRANYTSGDSTVKIKKAGTPSKSRKRGVGYNFTTSGWSNSASSPEKRTTRNTELDMDLLMSGDNGISWFYGWGIKPDEAVINAAVARGLVYAPMQWSAGADDKVPPMRTKVDEAALRTQLTELKAKFTDLEYLLAFNEPNFWEQGRMSPANAGEAWVPVKKVAQELNLKLISPAMNFGAPWEDKAKGNDQATRAGYPDWADWVNPFTWLAKFFEQSTVDTDDVHAISVHAYPYWPNAIKSFLDDDKGTAPKDKNYKQFGKPIWVTEFCAWEDHQGRLKTWEDQAWYMTQVLPYFELDPDVERYAWYIPKGHEREDSLPYQNLLTDVSLNGTDLPKLTPLGIIFTNMTTCDKTVWVPAGRKIDAAQFTDCNASDCIGKSNQWQAIPQTGINSDSDQSAGVLEIHTFTNNMWVEYQVNLPSTKDYTLTLRYKAPSTTSMVITVDGGTAKTETLALSTAYTDKTVSLGNISNGNHTIRFKVGSVGNCSLNWLKIE